MERKQNITEVAKISNVSPRELQWATWIVRSRGFTTMKLGTGQGVQSRTVLLPYIDMVNHNDEPNAEIQILEIPGAYDESFYALRAIRDISRGAEISVMYGTGMESSLDLFSTYGFWTHGTPDWNINWQLVDPEWTTSLKEDKNLLTIDQALSDARRKAIEFRVYLKSVQLQSENNNGIE